MHGSWQPASSSCYLWCALYRCGALMTESGCSPRSVRAANSCRTTQQTVRDINQHSLAIKLPVNSMKWAYLFFLYIYIYHPNARRKSVTTCLWPGRVQGCPPPSMPWLAVKHPTTPGTADSHTSRWWNMIIDPEKWDCFLWIWQGTGYMVQCRFIYIYI